MRVGPDGKQQKTSLDPPANAQPEGGRLKKRVVEKKKEEYKDYADLCRPDESSGATVRSARHGYAAA
ncbi:MAG: hypothetical protein WBW14_17925, partial [Candidatus Acidiferrum sp.]